MKSLDDITIRKVTTCYSCHFFEWTPGNSPVCLETDKMWPDDIIPNPREKRPEWCPLPILIEGE